MYSMAMNDRPVASSTPTSWTVTIPGWVSMPGGLRLAQEALAELVGLLGVVGDVEGLEGDPPADDRVAGQVDDAHRPLAEDRLDLVPAKPGGIGHGPYFAPFVGVGCGTITRISPGAAASSALRAARTRACSESQRATLLDDVAWPAKTKQKLKAQAAFFDRLRDLAGSAFFSSKMGVHDLGYMGNVPNPDWQGAPPAALAELGVSYAEWDKKYGDLK